MSYDNLRKGRVSIAGHFYSITIVTHNRQPYFRDFQLGRIVIAEMRRLHDDGLVQSCAWVLMPEHLHWLFQLGAGLSLSDVVRTLKARSAHRINKTLVRQGAVWQKAFHDHAIRREEDLRNHGHYWVTNPLRRGIVTEIGCYPLWDAVWISDD